VNEEILHLIIDLNGALITVLYMQCASFLRGTANISLLGVRAVLRRNIFTIEGHGKGNEDPCSSVCEREQEEVMKLKDFNMDGGCQYIE
jgi:hypothetical protein